MIMFYLIMLLLQLKDGIIVVFSLQKELRLCGIGYSR